MEIGILTFHFANNFGALLQCYALQEYLSLQGHSVKVINYIPPNIRKRSYLWQLVTRKISIALVIKIYKKIRYAHLQNSKFKQFRDTHLNLSELYDYGKLSDVTNEFDAIIVGSDQVWGPGHHKIGSYFLTHLRNFEGRRISYAPCCAFNFLEKDNKVSIESALKRFDSISVRNLETKRFVNSLIGFEAPIVVDPTLLWDFKDLINDRPVLDEKYILTYVLGNEIIGGHKNVIRKLKSKYKNHKIISVMLTDNNPQLFNWSDKTYWTADPLEWLSLFKYASFIYTDSFHGLLFSIKFKKPFIAFYSEKARSSRFIDFTRRFKFVNHVIVESYDDAIKKGAFTTRIDYELLHKDLDNEVEKSTQYIGQSLA